MNPTHPSILIAASDATEVARKQPGDVTELDDALVAAAIHAEEHRKARGEIAALRLASAALLAALDKHEDAADRGGAYHYRAVHEDEIYAAKAALRDLLPKEQA